MLEIYCGDGKGKTTAAVGLSVRMAGSGGKVLFVQFLKSGNSSEIKNLQQLGIKTMACDKEYGFWNTLIDDEKQSLVKSHNSNLEYVKKHMNEFDMIVLDEMCAAYSLGTLDKELAQSIVELCKAELVITGRNPDKFFCDRADYISEIKCVKHPFDKGAKARKGIEY